MLKRNTIEALLSTRQFIHHCTCVLEIESDSDHDTDTGHNVDHNEVTLGSFMTSYNPLKNSEALHNAETLRQATLLDNVFCSCYDVDTVLNTVRKREKRGHFSPVQKLLLAPESMKQIFVYATRVCESDLNCHENEQNDAKGPHTQNHARYRQAFVATEIILRFYLNVMVWNGDPKQDSMEDHRVDKRMEEVTRQETIPRQSSDEVSGKTVSLTQVPPATIVMDFRSNMLARKAARIQRLRAGMMFESSGSSISDYSGSDEDKALMEDPSTRGYLLQLEDLTANEWKRIFGGMFQFLWLRSQPGDKEDTGESKDDAVEVDSVLVANMCKITKQFVVFPGVHRLICSEDESDEKEWLVSHLAAHAYNPEIASLLHGLIHLSFHRGCNYSLIIRCLVQQIVEQVPSRLVRSLSSVSSTSTVSSTPSVSPRSSIGGSPTIRSSSFISSKTAPLSALLFTSNTASASIPSRISGCAEILSKVLTDEFPNTFRYYIQTKIQLVSFESVDSFERELFPLRMPLSDSAMHEELKHAVLAALTEDVTVLSRLNEIGIAELRFLDAHHTKDVRIPRILIIDVLRHAIEFSKHNAEQLAAFVAPVHLILDTLCASINYHQHLSTIVEYAARDCFSDSDSDDEEVEDGKNIALLAHLSGKDSPCMSSKRDALSGRSAIYMGVTPPAISYSSTSGKSIVNHRPLASTLLVVHVVELLNAIILMSNIRIDSCLTQLNIATSLMEIFEKFPTASILHCRLVKLYLSLLNRPSTNGRVNNPLLRSIFRSPDSILKFISNKLDTNTSAHVYDAHLAIIGVKIAKICSSPTLQQELIRQFCDNVKGWNDFASSLVSTHYQQMDVLDNSLLGLQVTISGVRNDSSRKRNTNEDDADKVFLLARPSSSASEYLSCELEPFRRLPMEKEGFGSSQNLACGNKAVHPSDMLQSRSQSKFPESIIDIVQSDASTSFDVEEDDCVVSGYVYQKSSKWAKVFLKFDKATCQLSVQDVSITPPRSSKTAIKRNSQPKPSFFEQLLMAHKQVWTSRPKTFVVCNARRWIVFHRGVKNRNRGAFGFQIEVFDSHREEDKTLTFVTGSDALRTRWVESMQFVVTRAGTPRNGFSDIDEAANLKLVESVAKNLRGPYLVVPDVTLLGPMTSASFCLKSEVPEEMPFWGTYHGNHGIIKYASLLNQCLDVVLVDEKKIEAIGYSVIVEFDATFSRSDKNVDAMETTSVTCTCTDTYLISGTQIIGLTRTIADSEKLLQLLCDEE